MDNWCDLTVLGDLLLFFSRVSALKVVESTPWLVNFPKNSILD